MVMSMDQLKLQKTEGAGRKTREKSMARKGGGIGLGLFGFSFDEAGVGLLLVATKIKKN